MLPNTCVNKREPSLKIQNTSYFEFHGCGFVELLALVWPEGCVLGIPVTLGPGMDTPQLTQ